MLLILIWNGSNLHSTGIFSGANTQFSDQLSLKNQHAEQPNQSCCFHPSRPIKRQARFPHCLLPLEMFPCSCSPSPYYWRYFSTHNEDALPEIKSLKTAFIWKQMRRKKERTPEPAIYPVITDSPGQTLGPASPRPRAMPSPARHLELQVISACFWRRQKGNPEPIITLEKCKLHLGWDDLQPNEGL